MPFRLCAIPFMCHRNSINFSVFSYQKSILSVVVDDNGDEAAACDERGLNRKKKERFSQHPTEAHDKFYLTRRGVRSRSKDWMCVAHTQPHTSYVCERALPTGREIEKDRRASISDSLDSNAWECVFNRLYCEHSIETRKYKNKKNQKR